MRKLILCVSILVAGCRSENSGEGYDAAVRLGGQWFNCDRLADEVCAVGLMHIPPIYRGEARRQEERLLGGGFNLLRDRFGGVSDVKPPTTDFRMAELFWSSGNADYWREHPRSYKATFPVKFSKLSDGYVQIEACKIFSKWQIRAIHYGLPMSNPSSKPMIESINSDLSKVSGD